MIALTLQRKERLKEWPPRNETGFFIEKLLFDEFYRVSFFQAVQLLETVFAGKRAMGEALSPVHEAVRFSVTPGLSFPASDIRSETGRG
jgi:type VI secretion system protein ImpH